MIPATTIEDALGVHLAISSEMAGAIDLWSQMFQGESPWLRKPDCPAKNLGLAGAVAGELARLTTIEMKSEITGSQRAAYLQQQYEKVLDSLRIQTEYGCALGGLIFKPYLDGKNIAVDYVQADSFYPVSFGSDKQLTAVVFQERIIRDGKRYQRLEYHHLEPEGCVVENRAFESNADTWNGQSPTLGKPIPLTEVNEWSALDSKVTLQGIEKLLIGHFKVPLANKTDPKSPLGVSVYSGAVNLIQEADEQWARFLWEFEGAELAVHADESLFKHERGEPILPQGKERLYRSIPGADVDVGKLGMETFSPSIRDASLVNGLNRIFQRIEFNCNLAYGTISDPQVVDKTAEEIRNSKQRSYAMVVDIQKALQAALTDLIDAMNYWSNFDNPTPKGEYEVSFSWDDSIVADRQAEFAEKLQLMAAGVLRPEELRAWYTGESEEEAKKNLPRIEEPDHVDA